MKIVDTSPMDVDPRIQTKIVQSLAEKLRASYIFPDRAEQICAYLQQQLAEGKYAEINDGKLFTLALTMDMQEVSQDEHLWIKWHTEPLPAGDGPLRQHQEWQDERRLQAKLDNYGLHKAERLPGNIGYLDIRYFHRPEWGGDAAVAAMNFLASTSALIFDLRKCTGGYPGMISLISSYLFGEEPLHLDSIYWRDEDITQQYWTLPYIPGRRFGDKPVYVLVSKATFSAGEGFAYLLQTRQRATLVGEKTDGGAHPGASYRLLEHFEVFIPIGRSINPLTGRDWEGIGVLPDISIPHSKAFEAAYYLALKTITATLSEPPAGPFMALLEEAQSALKGLESNHRICQKCGYPSPLYSSICRNCDEPLPDRS